jgi:hypothetical protein
LEDNLNEISYLVGLDIGQVSDYTALAILERTKPTDRAYSSTVVFGAVQGSSSLEGVPVCEATQKKEKSFAVRHLERFPLGTSYPKICERVADLFDEPPLSGGTLAVDQTGVGRAVVDMIRRARPQAIIRPITIVAGHAVVPDEAGWHVPKRELVSVMQVLLQSRRLQVARGLPLAPVLVRELETFRVKITASANETFESWRERDHDDLVLSVAMAAWVGDRALQQFWMR